jgi:stage V sporulation protein G
VEITRVTVREIDMNMVKGIASIILDDCFVVHDLRVVDGDRGYFVAMPSRKLPNGDFKDIAHPLNSETREKIQEAVLREFFKLKKGQGEKPQGDEDL